MCFYVKIKGERINLAQVVAYYSTRSARDGAPEIHFIHSGGTCNGSAMYYVRFSTTEERDAALEKLDNLLEMRNITET